MKNAAVFGANGAIGSAIASRLESEFSVVRMVRGVPGADGISTSADRWCQDLLTSHGPLDAVVWAQGVNSSKPIQETSSSELNEVFAANVTYIVETLNELISHGALSAPSRLVILSSVWQEHARANKFSYIVSKSSLHGFVQSAAIDLASSGVSVNAVLPGVIDTPMTRANLSASSIEQIEQQTPLGRLVELGEVAEVAAWLCSERSSGLTGQFITIDNGWSVNRVV